MHLHSILSTPTLQGLLLLYLHQIYLHVPLPTSSTLSLLCPLPAALVVVHVPVLFG